MRGLAAIAGMASMPPSLNAGTRYEAEAVALFSRMTVQPSPVRKVLISNLIKGLKANGTWTKRDAFYLIAAHDAQAARLNLIGDIYNLSAVASPTFTVDRGYQGDGSSSYLETGFNPTTAVGAKFQQDSGHIMLWSRRAAASGGVAMGNGNTLIVPRLTGTDQCAHRVNTPNSATFANLDGTGLYTSSRTGSTAVTGGGYKNAAKQTGQATTSAAPDNASIRVLGRSTSVSFWDGQAALSSIGGGLTDAEVAADYAVFLTYMQAIGAA